MTRRQGVFHLKIVEGFIGNRASGLGLRVYGEESRASNLGLRAEGRAEGLGLHISLDGDIQGFKGVVA